MGSQAGYGVFFYLRCFVLTCIPPKAQDEEQWPEEDLSMNRNPLKSTVAAIRNLYLLQFVLIFMLRPCDFYLSHLIQEEELLGGGGVDVICQ